MTPDQIEKYMNLALKLEERFSYKAAAKIVVACVSLILGISIYAQPAPTFGMKVVAATSLCLFVRLVMGSPTSLELTNESRARLTEWKKSEGIDLDDDMFDDIR